MAAPHLATQPTAAYICFTVSLNVNFFRSRSLILLGRDFAVVGGNFSTREILNHKRNLRLNLQYLGDIGTFLIIVNFKGVEKTEFW